MSNSFNDWFEEMEEYSFRSDRFYDDFDFAAATNDYPMIVKWLKAAYEKGYDDGQKIYGGTV